MVLELIMVEIDELSKIGNNSGKWSMDGKCLMDCWNLQPACVHERCEHGQAAGRGWAPSPWRRPPRRSRARAGPATGNTRPRTLCPNRLSSQARPLNTRSHIARPSRVHWSAPTLIFAMLRTLHPIAADSGARRPTGADGDRGGPSGRRAARGHAPGRRALAARRGHAHGGGGNRWRVPRRGSVNRPARRIQHQLPLLPEVLSHMECLQGANLLGERRQSPFTVRSTLAERK